MSRRRYPPFYEKVLPITMIAIAVLILVLLVVVGIVLAGARP